MWFRRRPRVPIFVWFLALLGLGSVVQRRGRGRHWEGSSERRESYRRKRHEFLQKMDEAYSVWDEPDEETTDPDEQ